MVEIEFNYNQTITNIQSYLEEPFQNVINKYLQKSLLNPDSVCFLANGKPINPTESVENHMSQLDKQNQKMRILVTSIEKNDKNKEQVFVKSKNIICPKCKEPCRISTENYKIKLFECINGHETNNIKFTDFANTQEINISQITCDICKFKNKGNCPEGQFFICLTCQQNICLLCKPNHDPRHNIILYDQKNYICQKHCDSFIKFCKKCKTNICFACEEHEEHENVFLGNLKPNMEEKKNILNEMETYLKTVNDTVEKVIEKLILFVEDINNYYEINKSIFENYNVKYRNYQALQNLNEISYNNKIFEKLRYINNKNNINDKICGILELSNNINEENIENNNYNILENIPIKIEVNKIKEENNFNVINDNNFLNKGKNEMTINYNINNNQNIIKLFDNNFVKNNKDKCYLIINNEKKELKEFYNINDNHSNTLEIKLCECESKNITSMYSMFDGCSSLKSLPDISEWDTIKITDMRYMFHDCSSLKSLADISKWNMINVTSINSIFSGCSSLKSLPDISKWDLKNISSMSSMFNGCSSLKSLPDISKWDITNITNLSFMFNKCSSLKSLPDLSQWNTKNVAYMSYIFYGCSSLNSLPDISKWDVKNVIDMSYMFRGCSSLKSLPDISKWDIKKVNDMNSLFYGCNSLRALPDISKWNIKNVTKMSSMFSGCNSLKSFPEITKWKLNKSVSIKNLFEGVDEKIIPKKFRDRLYY